ncbi:DNA methyltransferase [Pseudonocardia sp. Ae717_Ps2]|uniref:DNA methyltransferase n=1 Tax=Pseudonocardia sp. Ae717_Ps2 TaxID=1885573 RepID=UPI00351078EB
MLRTPASEASVVLDPWNGSGTTTLAAASLGIQSIGIDLNPAANVVAEARFAAASRPIPELEKLGADAPWGSSVRSLGAWFAEESSIRLSQWTRRAASAEPDVRALILVAIFRTIRDLTKTFEGSNPTWVRRARSVDDLINPGSVAIDTAVHAAYRSIVDSALGRSLCNAPKPHIVDGSAGRLPIRSGAIDRIITSPPYLTRIDYGVAYSRELAALGVDLTINRHIRAELMGTTLIRPNRSGSALRPDSVAAKTLEAVRSHPSKDSAGYYRKQFEQYLTDLRSGITELSRVASKGASMTVVVQDSYYKDVEVRLADIFVEEAEVEGWTLSSQPERFNVSRLLTTMNTPARAYEKGAVSESVLRFARS